MTITDNFAVNSDFAQISAGLDEPITDATEASLANRMAERHRGELRFVAKWGTWMIWEGDRWKLDDTRRAFDLARAVCEEAAANNAKRANQLTRSSTIRGVEYIASARRWIAATTDEWDLSPWLLNTPGGTWDLHGDDPLRPHDPVDQLTKVTAVSADGSKCPTWRTFLDRVTGGDLELQVYLQRMAGYMLTGSTEEHAMFFVYGPGGNGKSIFVNTIAGILGDYHQTAAIETFMASRHDRHPADLAMLRGARLVTAIETQTGRSWDEAKIKHLTGGDRIAARFMHQNFFEFTPSFKLLFAGNHKPRLRSVDEAMRRRFNLIPFTVTIPPEERDTKLPEKLRAEWPGILSWMIEGCLDWRRERLSPPPAVVAATSEYFASQDSIGAWLDECCTIDPNARTARTELFGSWEAWAERNAEPSGRAKEFYEALGKRGFEPTIRAGTRQFRGLTWRTETA